MQRLFVVGITLAVGIVMAGVFLLLFQFDTQRGTGGAPSPAIKFDIHPLDDEPDLPVPDLPLILEENWEEGIVAATWKRFGEPLPLLKAELGRDESTAFDPGGDKNYESGVVSRFDLDLTQGAVIEFWAKGRATGPSWQSASIGISLGGVDDYEGIEGQPAHLIRTYVGAEEDLHYIEYRLGAEFEHEPYKPHDDSWHHYRIAIDPDGTVTFYRDGEVQFRPDAKIDFDVYAQGPVMVEGRSWETDILIDDLRIYGTPVWPDTLEIESSSSLFRTGRVLGRDLDSVTALVVADVDNSGVMDLVAATNGASHQLLLWRDPGDLAGFPRPVQVLGKSIANIWRILPADIDNDGDIDLITTHDRDEPHEVNLWINPGPRAGDEPWPTVPVGKVGNGAVALAVGDIDGDGDVDIVSGANAEEKVEIFLWENDGASPDNAWIGHELGATDDSVFSLALADLDNDGDLDLISGGRRDEDAEVIIWENDGVPFDGRWTPTDVGEGGSDTRAIAVVDLDDDGWIDVVSASAHRMEGEVIAWRNDGAPFDGPWEEQDVDSVQEDILAIKAVDLDGDGLKELIGVGRQQGGGSNVRIWRNDAPFAEPWSPVELGELGEQGLALAVADMDGDGDRDVISGSRSMVVIWENDPAVAPD